MKPIFLAVLFHTAVYSWDLTNWGFDKNYYVSSIAVYGTRTFLALPRSVCHNGVRNPTVVEISKTGDHFFVTLNVRHKILDYQKWTDCADIQDAISLSVDFRGYKLWILDKGNEFCQPKIISFSFFYNTLSESCELTDIPGDKLNTMIIDFEGNRAYIGNAGASTLLVITLDNLKWWKVELEVLHNSELIIKTDYLAISKTHPELLITGREGTELYSLDVTNIRNMEEPSEFEELILFENVTLRGHKLGVSSSLETDYKSGVSYFMIKDYAIVRWNTEFPIEAEYHNVLAQSYERLPYVSQLFTGPQYELWALVNPTRPDDCTIKNGTEGVDLEIRLVKIFRYNKFIDEMNLEGQLNF